MSNIPFLHRFECEDYVCGFECAMNNGKILWSPPCSLSSPQSEMTTIHFLSSLFDDPFSLFHTQIHICVAYTHICDDNFHVMHAPLCFFFSCCKINAIFHLNSPKTVFTRICRSVRLSFLIFCASIRETDIGFSMYMQKKRKNQSQIYTYCKWAQLQAKCQRREI